MLQTTRNLIFHFSGVICLCIIHLSICKSLCTTEVWTFSSLGYVEFARLRREFTRSQFSCVHFKTRSGHTTLHLQAITLEVLTKSGLQSVITLSPFEMAMTAALLQSAPSLLTSVGVERRMTVASHDAACMVGVARTSCGAACMGGVMCTSHGVVWAGQHFLAWHIYRWFQMDFSVMFGLAVNAHTQLCSLHGNRTSAFCRNRT